MKTTVTRALILALSSATFSAIALTGVAHADRKGAPIRYAAPSSPDAAQQALQAQVQSQAQTPEFQYDQPTLTADQRVQFRYPGEAALSAGPVVSSAPVVAESMGAIAMPAVTSAPVAAETMKALGATSTVTAGNMVMSAAPKAVFTTTELAGGALSLVTPDKEKATPEPKAAEAPRQPIRIASLQTNKPLSTGKPLTLSRVKVNRDANVSEERGKAGIYTDGYDGVPTANGEIFDASAMTAAHPSLPLPSLVQVINEDNRREVVVRVNDRGPFDGQRILELSPRAGTVLGMSKNSTANVRLRYLGPAPVKQAPVTPEPVQASVESYASNTVQDDSMPPVTLRPPVVTEPTPFTTVADYAEPSLGVPDPVEPSLGVPDPVDTVQTAAPTALGNVFIQAGAFADISNAQNLTRALDRRLSVRIEEARVNGGDYFRVLIGPFANQQAAEVQRAQLSRAGIVDGFLTTR